MYGNTSLTLWVYYLNVGCWATEGHSDFLEAGVKRHLPGVADPAEVICGQQVDLGWLHRLLHPFQNLQERKENMKNALFIIYSVENDGIQAR